jgi:hypothetical protein
MTTKELRGLLDRKAKGTLTDAERQALESEMRRIAREDREWVNRNIDCDQPLYARTF